MAPSDAGGKVWTHVWSHDFTKEENRSDIERERKSVRWHKIKRNVEERLGGFANLRVIEIGAGRGIYSVLFALQGARVSLLDNSDLALQKARELFDDWGQNFQAIHADAFSPPAEFLGKYDVCMSYGFAEHFRYPERLHIFESHLRLVKPGGMAVVSVPNRFFLPYRIGKWMLEVLKKWEFGVEIPFSRAELRDIAKRLGVRDTHIVGSGVVSDFLNFWLVQRAWHLPGFFLERIRFSLTRKSSDGLRASLKTRRHFFPHNPRTFLDDHFGYALVLIGQRPSG